jgi:hypothetical protein
VDLEIGHFIYQSDGCNCGPIADMKIVEIFYVIGIKKEQECYKKDNICCLVMAEWDRLVMFCDDDLPVTVWEKLVEGSMDFCFCCHDLPSMKFIHLPCCKASVHIQCALAALRSNNKCVYCQRFLNPQDIIDLPTLS